MPIVIIEAEKPLKGRKALGAVNQAIAESLGLPRSAVWVRYECVPRSAYWEGDGTGQWAPVLVTVRLLKGRNRKALARMMKAVAEAVAEGFGMDKGSVWCRVDEMDPGLVSQGGVPYGKLMRKR
ncbi:MAG: tautomerase family protein [Euryarchaeota archaeon]|nr:tautomerase family protein [Euryarchaeota archaeon]